ncbi:hypothetical protein CLAFUW4_08125 [Fulvia fulva]|uniref:Uncharacterized protein n=1 Tax=Passalora fulva TaxID=5499 RepID=A0A9Q8LCI2_PASFU|nr:uncharacterized protein CLAFUR5_08240 [Fulvia fulva]KAK4629543.1 hypothetical protein CLAFUR4_08130 [Fulvia fulva]KAK4630527.1 hypothetical protein CLAFUR0_08125 [Fulvia fulva]UJO14694.1 hypothetical protein CLAFUR5_08240 [Fulvia fulva]WPV12190.1 hypothetical protein CLAFUW4_08125 [Fulvia fulva]WPV27911.1 hypothetical protein CLAFUW7_08125 [Fulvia fulva]
MKTSTVLLHASAASASTIVPRQSSSNTATVDLSVKRGTPGHLASGFIYGIPDTNVDHFYTDMGFNYARVGDAYRARFQSTKNNYITSRKYGAKVIILPHDIWGTDHADSSTVWPGDNGNWADYDKFLNQLIGDLKSNNMLQGLVFDIWNEPGLGGGTCCFWQRSQAQYLDLYVRTHKRIRSDSALNGVLISGPSSSSQPGSSFWTAWLQRIV